MTDQDRVILERLKLRLSQRLSLHRVILFGSRARGDADAESDMDVLVVLNNSVNPWEEEYVRECAWEAGVEQGIVLVPLTVARSEWEEGPLSSSLLAIGVAQDGVAI
jgi:hypothetical protein